MYFTLHLKTYMKCPAFWIMYKQSKSDNKFKNKICSIYVKKIDQFCMLCLHLLMEDFLVWSVGFEISVPLYHFCFYVD